MNAPVEATLSTEELPGTEPQLAGLERMQRITQRGTVRVGFLVDSLPFAYRNNAGEAVGFDIEMAHQLAADLEVGLELVRVEREQITALNRGSQRTANTPRAMAMATRQRESR